MIVVNCRIQPLILKSDNETFKDYENRIYSAFKTSFGNIKLNFTINEKPIRFRYHPFVEEKEEVFWHIVTTENNGARLKDSNRYSRIKWSEYVLFNCFEANEECSKAWIRSKNKRIHVWCTSIQYLVVLEERNDYVLFITAFPVNRRHTKEKLLSEYNRCDDKLIL